MWAGDVLRYKGDRYTADYENARLLINGKTIAQHKAHEEKQKQEEQQRTARGLRR